MPLDFSLLDSKDTSPAVVSVRATVHRRLVAAATALPAPLLLRSSDFYGDAEYHSSEIGALDREIRDLRDTVIDDDELLSTLQRLHELLLRAHGEGLGLTVLAD